MNVAKYIGMPFKPLGRDAKGCDCWGLTRLIYKEEFGIELPSLQYAEKFDPVELHDIMLDESSHWIPIEKGLEKPGDVLVLRSINTHVGVVVDRQWMIHIQSTTCACLDKFKRVAWKKRIMGIYRHAELA